MIGVALLDFGGPRGPEELVPFLSNLLFDVLPGPRVLRGVVAPAIARSRSKKVGPDYETIGWSPLVDTHMAQLEALRRELGDDAPPIASGMMYTPPTMGDCLRQLRDQGVDRIVALSMFPHYSLATTHSAFTMLWEAMEDADCTDLPVRWMPAWFEHPLYVQALAATIRAGVEATPGPDDEPVHLLFTPHGLPVSFVERGDPYPEQIRASVRAVVRHLDWQQPYHLGWQSRVGPVQWLVPGTPEVLDQLGRDGAKRVCMVPISFASEHIETLHEIDIEYREHALHAGIPHFARAPALGTDPSFISCLAAQVREGTASLSRYQCVRCLMPKPDDHRRRKRCPSCNFTTPAFLREGTQVP
jgi:ferrochelatase